MPRHTLHLDLPLPKGWPRRVRSAVLHAISIARYSLTTAHGWAANSVNARIRLEAQRDRLGQEVALLLEEIRIKDARMGRIPPHRRPHYPPVERMAILELRAARGWTASRTAERFLVTPATIASWMQRLDEDGPDALVQVRQPVNRFPDFVAYIVRRLKVLCPSMGKARIAQVLCRIGLHLGSTTVGRMLKERPRPRRSDSSAPSDRTTSGTLTSRPCDLAAQSAARWAALGRIGEPESARSPTGCAERAPHGRHRSCGRAVS
ncbi:MAG: helix-turn-helix domain-containing protein [Planctomycetota bacterium]|jgi:transcriptional regulator with XRE-family HTH domain